MGKHYTGVGSRETPKDILILIERIAYKLASKGWRLRSGAARGADYAFEKGVSHYFEDNGDSYPAPASLAQIYIPWLAFCEIPEDYKDWYKVLDKLPNRKEAEQIASEIHPAWERLSRGAKLLHTRNVYQVLGTSLNAPSQFLICWAKIDKHGNIKGGTRTAWELAKKYNIECFNLANAEDLQRLMRFVEE